MKRIVVLIGTFIVLLTACQQSQNGGSAKEQIAEYKKQINELNKKIEKLEGQVVDSSAQQKLVYVKTKTVKPEYFEHNFSVGGVVEAIQKAYISPEMNGQIKQIYVKEGQRVQKGDLLVSLNASAMIAQLNEAKTGLELATTMYKKQKALWEDKVGTEVQYLQAKTQKESIERKIDALNAQIAMTQIRAPFDGIVDEILRKEGEMGTPGFEVIRMINLNKMEVNADVAEAYMSTIGKGDEVELTFPTVPDMKIKERIARTGNIINPANRTFEVNIQVDNRKELLKPNAVAVLEITDYINKSAFVVPSIVVKEDVSGEYFLFVVDDSNGEPVAKKQIVKIGRTSSDKTEVISGLKNGMKIIVEGYNLVSSGVRVKF